MNRLQGENRKWEVYPDDEIELTLTEEADELIKEILLAKVRQPPMKHRRLIVGASYSDSFLKQLYSDERLVIAYGRYCGRMREYRLIQEFMEARHGKDKLPQDSNSLSTRP